MEVTDPRVPPALMPAGSKAIVYAADQQDKYVPLPSVRTPDGKVVTRWVLTDAEKAALIRGEDLYVTVLTFNAHLQPLMVSVGPLDLTKVDDLGRPLS